VSERGIRCCYHGWLFDVDGTILETPGEPVGSTFKDRLCHGAYPVHEFQGIIFAYMGPPEDIPAFPMLDVYEREGYRLMPGKRYNYPCNWLQIVENAADPVHASFLHTIVAGTQFTDEFGVVPNMEYIETPSGMVSLGTRRIGDNIWVRTVELLQPNLQQVAPVWNDGKAEQGLDGPMMSRWIVPRDDTSTMLIELRHISEDEEREPAWWLDRNQMLPAQLPVSDDPREQQLQPGDYEAQISQRPIAIHGLEHLGATDRGVTVFRRQIRRGIRAVQAGEDLGLQVSDENERISTYCIDTTVHIPPAATPDEDITLLLETGRRYFEEYLKNPPHQK
jgi:phenylpropionate dioxygenase-like ring-hydroxylating dioxygenase large terminal subunit